MNLNQREIPLASSAIRLSLDEDGEEIAHIFLYLIKNDRRGRPYALLEDLFVQEHHRRKGVGTRLLKIALQEARACGCYKLIATSRHSRKEVHQFYLDSGFENWGVEFRINFK